MLRGFMNALDAHDQNCSNFFICQAAQESRKIGDVGKNLAKIASSNAESWLTNINIGTKNNGLFGTNQIDGGCDFKFPCRNFQKTYKKPKLI